MNNPTFGLLGLVIQSFAIFVALSTVLGRIYFQSYFQTLGIPTSEVRLSVTDYAIFSPDTTVLGIGIAIAAAVLWWVRPDSSTTWQRNRIVTGAILSLVGLGLSALSMALFSTVDSRILRAGLFGAWMLVPLILSATGGMVITSGSPSQTGDATEVAQKRRELRIFLPIIIIIFVVGLIIIASSYAILIGRLDAESTLQQAPPANIEFSSSDPSSLVSLDSDRCSEDSLSCNFRVILIGDKFVYLSPMESDLIEGRRLYAFPVTDIAGISYMLDD